jgi:hypothetical protein
MVTGMSSSDLVDIVITLVVLAWVLYRQTVARPVSVRRLWLLPAILIVLGVISISHVNHGHLSGTADAYLAVDVVSSIALGALRGFFVRVYGQDGVMWRQGSAVTIALWIVSIAVRVLVGILAANAGVGNVSDAALEVAFGLSLASQNAVVAWSGLRQGLPFAEDPRRARRI